MGVPLSANPFPWDEDSKYWSQTDEACSSCGEPIAFTEEIVLLTISQAWVDIEGKAMSISFLDDDDDFIFEPHFLHIDCWESISEELEDMVRDEPPLDHPQGVIACKGCGSAVCEGELLLTIFYGELQISRLMPDGRSTTTFEASPPNFRCISCTLLINEHSLELWEDVNQLGECQECTHARCWRRGATEPCTCICHAGTNEENEEETPT